MSQPTSPAGAVSILRIDGGFECWNELLALILRSFAYMDRIIDPPSTAHALTAESLQERARTEAGFIAMDGEKIVGCVFVRERDDDCYIGKLAVEPAMQGRGIGKRLLEAAETFAASRGKQAVELQTRVELTGNQTAFVRLGFVETKRTAHKGFDRPTSITLRKMLA